MYQWKSRSCHQITSWWLTGRYKKQTVQGMPSSKFWKYDHTGRTAAWSLAEIWANTCSSHEIQSLKYAT